MDSTTAHPNPTSTRAHRVRWRWLLAIALGAVVLATAATVVIATDLGTPAGRFPAAPDPCGLLDEPTVRALVGEARAPDHGQLAGRRRALHRDPDWRSCQFRSRGTDHREHATLRIEVHRFTGTQLRLGPSGGQRAEDYFELRRQMAAAAGLGDCTPLPVEPPGEVCGAPDAPATGGPYGEFRLILHRDNLVIVIDWSKVVVNPATDDPEELMPVVATEVLAALDR